MEEKSFTYTTKELEENADGVPDLMIGVSLAALSSVFIGASFIIKKISLQKLNQSGHVRASHGGFGYLTQWMWWTGLILMGFGEVLNIIAFAFAPASLVTPLGALSVLVTALLASFFLKESLNILSKMGCLLCVLGSSVVVTNAPQSPQVKTVLEVSERLCSPVFIWMVIFILTTVGVLLVYYSPRSGSRNILIYISICSLLGSLSVLCSKIIALAVKEYVDTKIFSLSPAVVLSVPLLAVFVCLQMVYLNKALDIFQTNIVTPVYYVFFTSSVLVASGVLFKEWHGMGPKDVVGILSGFGVIIIGVVMLNWFKNVDTSRILPPSVQSRRWDSPEHSLLSPNVSSPSVSD